MTGPDYAALLDVQAFPADGYAKLADRVAAMLGTDHDVLLMQGEAILSLEAVASSIARPDLRALNIVTSPYGAWFGEWLRRGSAQVTDLTAEPGKSITLKAVEQAIHDAQLPFDIVSLVHAESASGIVNPLEEIATLADRHGIITVVDAVASVGGHPLTVDQSKIDIAVIGPQKALGGPAGISAISISKRAWAYFDHPAAPRLSILSIMDQKEQWLDQGRGALPGTPSALEFHAFQAALNRIDAEGFDALLARHRTTSQATRRGVSAGGLNLWSADHESSHLVTTLVLPVGVERAEFLARIEEIAGHTIAEAVGPGTERLIRLNHTGTNARLDIVSINIAALAHAMGALALHFDQTAAQEAVFDR